MTNIGDLLADEADKLMQASINVGDVHFLNLDQSNGITPKDGNTTRNKFFIVLGFDNNGNVIGGLVINSKINYNLPPAVTDYQLPITAKQCPFLHHDSFVNCSIFVIAKRTKFSKSTYRGVITEDLLGLIISTLKESPTRNDRQLKDFGII